MNPQKLPSRLKTDNLIDAFVEIQFETELTDKAILDRIISKSDIAYNRIPHIDGNGNLSGKYFLSDGTIRFFVLDGKLGINIIGGYPGWNKYCDRIHALIFPLSGDVIFTAVRVKYVSKWNNISILSKLDGEFRLNQFPQLFNGTELSFPAIWNSDMPGFNAKARVSLKDSVCEKEVVHSLIDIDVSIKLPDFDTAGTTEYSKEEINGSRVVFGLFEAHKAEKDMFFRLLSEDFVNTLI